MNPVIAVLGRMTGTAIRHDERSLVLRLLISPSLAVSVAMIGDLQAAPSTAVLPAGIFNYDANSLDSPYIRTANYYGFDKVDSDPNDRWTNIFGDFHIPLLANLGVGAFYDDNVLNNNLDKRASFGTTLTPSITMPFGSRAVATTLNYAMRANIYENVGYANTVSNFLRGSTSFEFDHRNHMVLTARGTPYAQDPIGTYFSQGAIANTLKTPNTYNGYGFDANYVYGAKGAKGNILLNFSMNNRNYTNNPQYTYQRDLNSYNIGGGFLWRVMPKTQLLFEVDDTIMDYLHNLNDGTSINGSLYRAYTGATWQASAKTKAVVKIGYQTRVFDYSGYKSQSGPAFQGMLEWTPGSYDSVWVNVSNALNEPFIGSATAAATQNYTVNWSHQWLERFNTQLGAFYFRQRYTTTDLTTDTINARFGAIYTIHPGLWMDMQYTYTDRTSNENQYDINRNMVLLNVRMIF